MNLKKAVIIAKEYMEDKGNQIVRVYSAKKIKTEWHVIMTMGVLHEQTIKMRINDKDGEILEIKETKKKKGKIKEIKLEIGDRTICPFCDMSKGVQVSDIVGFKSLDDLVFEIKLACKHIITVWKKN